MTDAAATPSKTEFVLARPNLSVKDVLKEAETAGVALTSPYVYKIRVRAGQGKRAAKKAAAMTAAAPAPAAKRGRKPSAPAAAPKAAVAPKAAAPKVAAKRGRPKKVAVAAPVAALVAAPVAAPKVVAPPKVVAKRGRPKRVAAPAAPSVSTGGDAAAALRGIVIEYGVARTRAIVDEIAAKLQALLAGK
jgi:hypothetical protein